jgi:hypothetical protein
MALSPSPPRPSPGPCSRPCFPFCPALTILRLLHSFVLIQLRMKRTRNSAKRMFQDVERRTTVEGLQHLEHEYGSHELQKLSVWMPTSYNGEDASKYWIM